MTSSTFVPDFTALRVAVVGDLIADHYVFTEPTRLSREAPVMVLRHSSESLCAGGAANVARNLWTLGARTLVIGAVGADPNGRKLRRLLEDEQVDVEGVVPVPGWITPTKTRICAAETNRTMQQVLRMDREPDAPLEESVRRNVAERVLALAGEVDALILSDYAYGLVDAGLADAARVVREAGATVVLDPRLSLEPFHGLSAITPNLGELAQATGVPISSLESAEVVADCAAQVLEAVSPEWLLVTLGNRGMALFSKDLPHEGLAVASSGPTEGVDPTGAGDTAAATFTLSLAAGRGGPEAMRLANAASGVVVMESGTAVCTPSRLRSALPDAPRPCAVGKVLSR